MKKRHLLDLLLLVMSLFVSGEAMAQIAAVSCYPTGQSTSSNSTWNNRKLNSITMKSEGETLLTISGIESSYTHDAYHNYVDENVQVVVAEQGATITPVIDWNSATGMHGFMYVDYNNNGEFSDGELGAAYTFNMGNVGTGIPDAGSELVSYTYKNGYNSAGETRGNNAGYSGENDEHSVAHGDMPPFVIPRSVAPGDYRVRYKIDWDNLDPCGGSDVTASSGSITDFVLRVVEAEPLPDFFTVTLPVVENGTLTVTYTDSDNQVQTLNSGENSVPTFSVLTVSATPATDYQLVSLTVNGVNFTNGSTCVVEEAITIGVLFAERNDYMGDNPFETMIRLGRMTPQSPIYQMPAGSVSGGYIMAATTSGDAVIYPLGYVKSSAPGSYFNIVSKETSLLSAGSMFQLNVTMSADPTGKIITTYTDWDRDGVYESVTDAAQITATTKSFTQNITIPEGLAVGKVRVRVRIETSTPSSADATVAGYLYDFVFYITESSTTERTDCFISATSSNTELGTAMIETAANANGRYDLGTEVTVKAVINTDAGSDVEFKGWQENGDIVSEDLVYTFVVEKSTNLVALFEAPVPELSTPQVSTVENPVWYQIMNAHTSDTRKERCLAYDTETTTTYSEELRVEKPATTDDKFLWRLEDAGDGYVYIVNRGSDLRVYSTGSTSNTAYLTAETTGSKFTLYANGVTEGNYTIRFEGDDTKRLNAQDGSWGVVLYSEGLGTGSGWYFYKVNVSSGVETLETEAPKAYLRDGHLTVTGLSGRNTLRTVSLTGQMLGTYVATDSVFHGNLKYAERFILLVIESEDGEQTILKLVDSRN